MENRIFKMLSNKFINIFKIFIYQIDMILIFSIDLFP